MHWKRNSNGSGYPGTCEKTPTMLDLCSPHSRVRLQHGDGIVGWDLRFRLNPGAGFLWSWLARRVDDLASAANPDAAPQQRRTPKAARLEAVLLVADGALSTRKLAQLATLIDAAEASQIINQLNAAYDAGGSAFRVERVATGFQLLTRPVFASWLDKLHHRQSQLKLSLPAMETLTIAAYRQPVTRADVEAIRGVQCTEMLKQLMERRLVKIVGHDESLGRPFLYGTTRTFLELFGLRTLNDLPMAGGLRRVETVSHEDGSLDGPPPDDHPKIAG